MEKNSLLERVLVCLIGYVQSEVGKLLLRLRNMDIKNTTLIINIIVLHGFHGRFVFAGKCKIPTSCCK
jgi:hypothetical protein